MPFYNYFCENLTVAMQDRLHRQDKRLHRTSNKNYRLVFNKGVFMTAPTDSNLPPSIPASAPTSAAQADQKTSDAIATGSTTHKTGEAAVAAQIKPSNDEQQLAIRFLNGPVKMTNIKSDIPVGRMIASLKETPDGRYQVVLNMQEPLKLGNPMLETTAKQQHDPINEPKAIIYSQEEVQQFAKLQKEYEEILDKVKYEAFEISLEDATKLIYERYKGAFFVRLNPLPNKANSIALHYKNKANGIITREVWSKGNDGKMSIERMYYDDKKRTFIKEEEMTEFRSFEEGLAHAHINGKINLDKAVTTADYDNYFRRKNAESAAREAKLHASKAPVVAAKAQSKEVDTLKPEAGNKADEDARSQLMVQAQLAYDYIKREKLPNKKFYLHQLDGGQFRVIEENGKQHTITPEKIKEYAERQQAYLNKSGS
jgi:hypothetical protein